MSVLAGQLHPHITSGKGKSPTRGLRLILSRLSISDTGRPFAILILVILRHSSNSGNENAGIATALILKRDLSACRFFFIYIFLCVCVTAWHNKCDVLCSLISDVHLAEEKVLFEQRKNLKVN